MLLERGGLKNEAGLLLSQVVSSGACSRTGAQKALAAVRIIPTLPVWTQMQKLGPLLLLKTETGLQTCQTCSLWTWLWAVLLGGVLT